MADLVLYNANIITMDPYRPRARRVVIRNGVIAEVSSNNHRLDHCPRNTFQVDCQKKTVLPGFIDSHFHFRAFADRFITLDLSSRNNIRSIGEMQQAIRDHAAEIEPGTWIRAKGYDEFRLAERRHPNRWDLDAASTEQALAMYTRLGAFSGFEETQKGSITPGKLGDMVVLNRDPEQVSTDELKEISVEMTICGGVVKWSK